MVLLLFLFALCYYAIMVYDFGTALMHCALLVARFTTTAALLQPFRVRMICLICDAFSIVGYITRKSNYIMKTKCLLWSVTTFRSIVVNVVFVYYQLKLPWQNVLIEWNPSDQIFWLVYFLIAWIGIQWMNRDMHWIGETIAHQKQKIRNYLIK